MNEHNDKMGTPTKVALVILAVGASAHWVAAMLGQWVFDWDMLVVNDNRVSAVVLATFAMILWTKKKTF